MTLLRRRAFAVIQVAFALAVTWYAGRKLADRWSEFQQVGTAFDPQWRWIVPASVVVLGTYLLLIHVWVSQLRAWGVRVPFLTAARMWFISNLGRYVPGKVWGIGTLVVMSQRRNLSPAATVGSSVLVMLIGLVSGLAVVLVTGAGAAELLLKERGLLMPTWAVPLAGALAILSLAAVPVVLPAMARALARATGKEPVLPSLPAAAVWSAALGTGLSWVFYGVAFQLFAIGVTGQAGGAPASYIAVYTAAYLVGLVSPTPAGAGVREGGLVAGLLSLGLATAPQALLIALASRVWLTILEVAPGGVALLIRPENPADGPQPPAIPSSRSRRAGVQGERHD